LDLQAIFTSKRIDNSFLQIKKITADFSLTVSGKYSGVGGKDIHRAHVKRHTDQESVAPKWNRPDDRIEPEGGMSSFPVCSQKDSLRQDPLIEV
jgi:hypothetical protein